MEPLALSAADGLNACIFAYGQTGSGKTHTMIGDAKGGEMAGISYRTMNKLFQVLELRKRQQVRLIFSPAHFLYKGGKRGVYCAQCSAMCHRKAGCFVCCAMLQD